MTTVLIELPGGAGVVRQDDGKIVITQDVSDDRGQPLRGRDDYRPVQTWLDHVRSIVAGLLPTPAVSAEIVDDRGTRVAAAIGGGVYAAILEQPNDGHNPVVCCRDKSGAPVPRPLPDDWTRTPVPDAQERCPACGAVAYDEVLPTDGSRGGKEVTATTARSTPAGSSSADTVATKKAPAAPCSGTPHPTTGTKPQRLSGSPATAPGRGCRSGTQTR